MTIDSVLAQIRAQLNLSKEEEWELLEEIRAHLEDAVADAEAAGKDRTTALFKAAEDFGVFESSQALQQVHKGSEMTQVILMCIVPVFFTLVLRWLVFSADGTITDWQPIFNRPIRVIIATSILLLPLTQIRRWPYVTVSWIFFWLISVIFIVASRN